VLGTTEIMLLNHTDCGFTTFTDDELNAKLAATTGDASPAPMRFFRSHPWIAKEVAVRGFVFDMETGLLSEVEAALQ
jgi:carbonic anhydrase